jgi:RNA polymerase sigma-70 factor (ECF subfamily)
VAYQAAEFREETGMLAGQQGELQARRDQIEMQTQQLLEESTSRVNRVTDEAAVLSDEDAVRRVLAGDAASFELLMRRYNQRMFRVVRSMLGNDLEAEDVVQDAYVRAFEHLGQFAGRARFSTWLIKIAVNEASARMRRNRSMHFVDLSDPNHRGIEPYMENQTGEQQASNKELASVLTRAIDQLPDELRAVFTLRVIEEVDTEETSACLNISEANVKVRLHRARSLLRESIDEQIGSSVRKVYQFDGERCDRIVHTVMHRLARRFGV